jgi:hypothetical protein
MAMMGQTIDIHKVHVHKGHRKKFVHGSWTVRANGEDGCGSWI